MIELDGKSLTLPQVVQVVRQREQVRLSEAGIAQVKIQDHEIRTGDSLQIHGPTTGVQELVLGEMHRDEERPEVGERGTWVTFKAPRCRVGDKVFFVESRP